MNQLTTPVLLCALLSPGLAAQQLREAVAAADLVVVATDIGVRPAGPQWFVHRLRVVETLKGQAAAEISVVELKGVGVHNKPAPAETRLYCLHDNAAAAEKSGLPAGLAPYFKMDGRSGSNPAVAAEWATDAQVTFARLGTEVESGRNPARLADQVVLLALRGPAGLRTEAACLLAERRSLLAAVTTLQWSELVSRAAGELDDIGHKIALAELCAEKRLSGLVESLAISLDQVADERYPRAVGRIAKLLHGEDAAALLVAEMQKPHTADGRGRLVVALGATSTDAALKRLLRLQETQGQDKWLEAALQVHGSRQALEAAAKRPESRPESGK